MLKQANEVLGARVNELESGAVLRATQSRLAERDEVRDWEWLCVLRRLGMTVRVACGRRVHTREKNMFQNNRDISKSHLGGEGEEETPINGSSGQRISGSSSTSIH